MRNPLTGLALIVLCLLLAACRPVQVPAPAGSDAAATAATAGATDESAGESEAAIDEDRIISG